MILTEIEMYEKNNLTMHWTINDADGIAVDITSALLVFSLKKNLNDTVYSFQRKNTAAGGGDAQIEITTGISGNCDVKVIPDNTSGLQIGTYRYGFDIVLNSASGTVAQDKFKIKERVT